jgi:hypothetical protein
MVPELLKTQGAAGLSFLCLFSFSFLYFLSITYLRYECPSRPVWILPFCWLSQSESLFKAFIAAFKS